jgi:hypothetical protein
MRLSSKALAVGVGVLWGGSILLLGLIHLLDPSYGSGFLEAVGSIYPGFHAARSLGDALVGTAYAFVDGAIAGLVMGWVYNLVSGRRAEA